MRSGSHASLIHAHQHTPPHTPSSPGRVSLLPQPRGSPAQMAYCNTNQQTCLVLSETVARSGRSSQGMRRECDRAWGGRGEGAQFPAQLDVGRLWAHCSDPMPSPPFPKSSTRARAPARQLAAQNASHRPHFPSSSSCPRFTRRKKTVISPHTIS